MKPQVPNARECPECHLVFKVLQVPWPYTGEWMDYDPKRCPCCGAEMKTGVIDGVIGTVRSAIESQNNARCD